MIISVPSLWNFLQSSGLTSSTVMPSLVRKPGVHGRSASGTVFDCGGGAGGGEEESFFVAASGLLFAEDGVEEEEEEEDEDSGVIGGLEIPAGRTVRNETKASYGFYRQPPPQKVSAFSCFMSSRNFLTRWRCRRRSRWHWDGMW